MGSTGIRARKMGLVLEGDALRGVFASGVLDYFLKMDLRFPYAVGVSAGAYNLMGYLSKQRGFIKNCLIRPAAETTLRELVRGKRNIDLNQFFHQCSQEIKAFDYDAFFSSGTRSEFGITCCNSGEVEYHHEDHDEERLSTLVCASCSIPLFSQMVTLDGKRYLSGELSGVIPIERSFSQGFERNVVILTRNRWKRPRMTSIQKVLYEKHYRSYPRLLNAIVSGPDTYKKQISLLEQLEKEKLVFLIRPQASEIKRFETDHDALQAYYQHGYETAQNCWPKLLEFINGSAK